MAKRRSIISHTQSSDPLNSAMLKLDGRSSGAAFTLDGMSFGTTLKSDGMSSGATLKLDGASSGKSNSSLANELSQKRNSRITFAVDLDNNFLPAVSPPTILGQVTKAGNPYVKRLTRIDFPRPQ